MISIQERVKWPSRKRYDAITIMGGNKPVVVDFTITNPGAPTHVAKAQSRGGAAASRADEKTRKYKPYADSQGYTFIPMSFEALGHWHSAAVKHVRWIANCAQKQGGKYFTSFEIYRGLVGE